MSIAWTAVTFLVWRILGEGENRWRTWILAGVVLGLGLISKYTIVLLAFSVVLLLLTEREWRKEFARPKLWVTMLIAALLCFPIIAWNIQYDWPTLKFHLHDRQTGGGGANFTRWGQYWASQAVALGPALFLVVLATGVVAARRFQDRRWRFLLVLSAPTFLIFTAQALYAEFKPHWPAPAYTLMFIGVAEWGRQGFGFAAQSTQKTARIAIAALVLAIVVPLNVVFHVGCVWPVIPKLARAFGAGATWEPKFDPTNDMYGWEKAAEEAKKIREEFAQRGERLPFLSSSRYQLVSQLAFVTQERVWRVSPGRDQYTFWQTDEDLNSIKGEPSIFITDNRFERDPRNDNIFESCEPRPPLDVYRGTELARRFHIYVCKGFRGIQ
jgi:dolichol-phosphate mannosyltransferase